MILPVSKGKVQDEYYVIERDLRIDSPRVQAMTDFFVEVSDTGTLNPIPPIPPVPPIPPTAPIPPKPPKPYKAI